MNNFMQLIFTILGLRSISKVSNHAAYVIGLQIGTLMESVLKVTHTLLDGKQVFKLSSGAMFHQDLANWINQINYENRLIDFVTAILEIFENTKSKVVKF